MAEHPTVRESARRHKEDAKNVKSAMKKMHKEMSPEERKESKSLSKKFPAKKK